VVDSKTLRKTFRPKREEVTGKWKKLHIEALHNLYSSQDIAWVIKSRRIRRAGNVAHTQEKHNADLQWGNLKERDHLEDQGVGMRIMLKWILNRMGGQWNIFGSGQGLVVAYCESRIPNELSGFTKHKDTLFVLCYF